MFGTRISTINKRSPKILKRKYSIEEHLSSHTVIEAAVVDVQLTRRPALHHSAKHTA